MIEEKENKVSRRLFSIGILATVGASVIGLGTAAVRFFIGDSFKAKKQNWIKLNEVSSLTANEVHKVVIHFRGKDAWRRVENSKTVYVFSEDGQNYTVLDATCTHLGCLVRWKEDDQHFSCPCHKGIFSKEGLVISGAPTKPLQQLEIKIENDSLFVLI